MGPSLDDATSRTWLVCLGASSVSLVGQHGVRGIHIVIIEPQEIIPVRRIGDSGWQQCIGLEVLKRPEDHRIMKSSWVQGSIAQDCGQGPAWLPLTLQ